MNLTSRQRSLLFNDTVIYFLVIFFFFRRRHLPKTSQVTTLDHVAQKVDRVIHWRNPYLAPVVRKLDSAIHRINRYPEDKYYDILLRYPVDSNLSSG